LDFRDEIPDDVKKMKYDDIAFEDMISKELEETIENMGKSYEMLSPEERLKEKKNIKVSLLI